jgi:hypothetical protein
MWPYRESFSRVAFGRELDGIPFYALTYLSLAAFYGVAMVAGSIWVPIQLVGATAGERGVLGEWVGWGGVGWGAVLVHVDLQNEGGPIRMAQNEGGPKRGRPRGWLLSW